MSEYCVDFDGCCSIEANSKREAEEKFWNGIYRGKKEGSFAGLDDLCYEILGIEGPETEEDRKRN